ncbi:MAG: class I SAM-dependent methyltransferase [Candidatus Eisenbacteria bacterium]|nr:class I SAM-dependent methyltransferase [Candidatus Eisenbacteria bacterium]
MGTEPESWQPTGLERFESADGFAEYADNPDLEARNRAILSLLGPASGRRLASHTGRCSETDLSSETGLSSETRLSSKTGRSAQPDQAAEQWLDVGCGPGIAGRALERSGRTVFSLDASRPALASGPPRPVCASIDTLPFADRSVDGVLCLEVLEHLPGPILHRGTEELARVTSRWLLVGVPHRENLARNLLLCPACDARFNRSGHLHRFEVPNLVALFPGFRVSDRWVGGPKVRDYPGWLLWVRHRVARRFSEMSGLKGNCCPRCGNRTFPPFRHNLLSFATDAVNRLLSRRRPYWLLILLEREA